MGSGFSQTDDGGSGPEAPRGGLRLSGSSESKTGEKGLSDVIEMAKRGGVFLRLHS